LTNKLVVENLKFRPVRTVLSVLAIGLEVTLMLTVVGLSRGMLAESQQRARGIGADIFVRPPGTSVLSLSSAPIKQAMVEWMQKQPHVAMAVGSLVVPLTGLTTATGIDLAAFSRMSGGFRYVKGGPPTAPHEAIVDRYYAQQEKLKVGSTLNMLNRDWRVSGIFEEGKLARIVVPMPVLQDLTSNTGQLSQIYLKLDDPKRTGEVIDDLKQKIPKYQIYSMQEFLSLISPQNVPALRGFIGVVIGLSVVVGFLVVFLSMYTAVLERTREVGIMKALGASPAFILGVLFRETALLGVVGVLAGIAFSFATRFVIMAFVPASLSQHIVPDWWPIAGLIALAGAMLGAAYPGLRAARQDPIEALSYE
jgi:putative ABC transport system permease protein